VDEEGCFDELSFKKGEARCLGLPKELRWVMWLVNWRMEGKSVDKSVVDKE
jgi:hypothetical protein